MMGTAVNLMKKENIKGVDFYTVSTTIYLQHYFKIQGNRYESYLSMPDMENMWKRCGAVYTLEENKNQVIAGIRDTLAMWLKNQKRDKEAVPRCHAYHYRLFTMLPSGRSSTIFDTMFDAPKYWKLEEEKLERVVNRLNIERAIDDGIAESETKHIVGYVEDEGELRNARVNENGEVCVEQWNNETYGIEWMPYTQALKIRAAIAAIKAA